jgi:hypothetical protein
MVAGVRVIAGGVFALDHEAVAGEFFSVIFELGERPE